MLNAELSAVLAFAFGDKIGTTRRIHLKTASFLSRKMPSIFITLKNFVNISFMFII